jgi:hypothetical protein
MAIDTEPLSEVGYIIISAALPSGGIAPLELMTSTPWIEAWIIWTLYSQSARE